MATKKTSMFSWNALGVWCLGMAWSQVFSRSLEASLVFSWSLFLMADLRSSLRDSISAMRSGSMRSRL